MRRRKEEIDSRVARRSKPSPEAPASKPSLNNDFMMLRSYLQSQQENRELRAEIKSLKLTLKKKTREASHAKNWLKAEGFTPGDLRSEVGLNDWIPWHEDHKQKIFHPMARACDEGELGVCKWLYNNGAAADITKATTNEGWTPMLLASWNLHICQWLFHVGAAADITRSNCHGETPMWWACRHGSLSVCKWLFDVGASADVTKADDSGRTPMLMACESGQLDVCKWLFDMGAGEDISKADTELYGYTPLLKACEGGHLSVCQWLFEMGATADISIGDDCDSAPMHFASRGGFLSICQWLHKMGAAEDISKESGNNNDTPMHWACEAGHLSVCQWLFEMGASSDIFKANGSDETPLNQAVQGGHLSTCKWLVLNGAANYPASSPRSESVDQSRVNRLAEADFRDSLPVLCAWAQRVIATHHTFHHVVLRASILLPASQQHANPSARCRLPRLPRVILERVGAFLDVKMGQRLRNVRQFAGAVDLAVALAQQREDHTEDQD